MSGISLPPMPSVAEFTNGYGDVRMSAYREALRAWREVCQAVSRDSARGGNKTNGIASAGNSTASVGAARKAERIPLTNAKTRLRI